MAKHTWNPRLGIVGGISILGTTGIVHPFSCSAWIASIHRGIDVARASRPDPRRRLHRLHHRRPACSRLYDLPEVAFIDMGDFAGGMLKYLRRHPLPRLTIGGGFGKLSKLAAGFGDLHSGRSQVDRGLLSELLAGVAGAGRDDRAIARGQHRERDSRHGAERRAGARRCGCRPRPG